MKIDLKAILLLLTTTPFPCIGYSSPTLPYIDGSIYIPTGLFIEKNDTLANNYKNTQCVNFHLEKRKNIGFLCSSSSQEFMKEFGIIKNTTEGEMLSHEVHMEVATAMASYSMKPTALNGYIIYTAQTDCDEDNGPVYRATSTCHIAIMPLKNGAFIYSNFVIENHVNSTTWVATQDIINLWMKLKINQGPSAPDEPEKINSSSPEGCIPGKTPVQYNLKPSLIEFEQCKSNTTPILCSLPKKEAIGTLALKTSTIYGEAIVRIAKRHSIILMIKMV